MSKDSTSIFHDKAIELYDAKTNIEIKGSTLITASKKVYMRNKWKILYISFAIHLKFGISLSDIITNI